MSSRLSQLWRRLRLEEEQEEEEEGILEGAGLSMMGGALAVGERAEQAEEERGLLTGQSSRRTHTSSDLSEKRPAAVSPPAFPFLHVPFDLAAPSSSLRPFSLDSDEADRTEEELPVRFHVPTRGNEVACLPAPPPPPVLLLSRFHVPVRLNRDDVTSCERDGLSECERLTSCLLVVDGSGVPGLVGDSDPLAAATDSSSFLFSVGLGASLMNVD